jgi:hypothetical protein
MRILEGWGEVERCFTYVLLVKKGRMEGEIVKGKKGSEAYVFECIFLARFLCCGRVFVRAGIRLPAPLLLVRRELRAARSPCADTELLLVWVSGR